MLKTLIAILIIGSLVLSVDLSGQTFEIQPDYRGGLLKIFKSGVDGPVVTQNAKKGMRPYLHPITTPDGKGVLTEIHPTHHLHQTGIYWGLKKVNGRDYFMNSGADYYQYQSMRIIEQSGKRVSWETVYDLIDEHRGAVLRETQTWSLREEDGILLLDLEWEGKGMMKVTVEKFYVGGLFMRMPWADGIGGEAINSIGEKNMAEAEGHRSVWVDVGMEITGLREWGHIAILDHPDNMAFPTPWRVDKQLGVGPSRQILGDWSLEKNETTVEKYRLVIYTGRLDREVISRFWKDYVCE